MVTIDDLIDETTIKLNQKIKVKQAADENAVKLKNQLAKFKMLKKNMDDDMDFAQHFEFK